MPKIDTIRLRSTNPAAQMRFYLDQLGMRERQDGTIGYADEQAGLIFEHAAKPYKTSNSHLYWKISISVPNIELACRRLQLGGVDVSQPTQMPNIGFMAHLKDPEGFEIELLDQWFQGSRPWLHTLFLRLLQ